MGKAEVYGDSAYGTGDLRATLGQAGHTAVIKPRPLKPAVEGGFTLDEFTVDEAAGTVTCPAGITRPITARRTVTFGAACRACPLRHRCTTRKDGRALILHEHDALLRAARARWATQPAPRGTTLSTGPTWSGPSPKSPPAAAGASSSATSAPPATTPGLRTAPLRSTCATSSTAA
jgi:Transposase DDE domain